MVPRERETHAARAKTFLLRGDLHLLVGRDVRDLEATLGLIRGSLAWGLALAGALAVLGGWLMSAGVLRRIEAITRTSRDIMDGDLSRRMPVDGSGDDFDQLAENLNRMLDRIEDLMNRVRQVSDSIAHDLRTPLTRLRTKLEGLREEGDPATQAALEAAVADADELLATFNALLRISRIEASGLQTDLAPVDLALVVRDIAELYEPLATERGQALGVSAAGPALGPGGSRSALPGPGQSGRQRRQVHPARGQDRPLCRMRRPDRQGRGVGRRSRHPGRAARTGLRALLPRRCQPFHPGQRPWAQPGASRGPAPRGAHRYGR